MFNDINLSEGADIEKRPTNFLCKLVRRLYTVEEIEKGIIHDDRMTAIKGKPVFHPSVDTPFFCL